MTIRNISNRELARRCLVARLQSRITDVIGEFVSDDDGITYTECLKALHEAMGRMVGELIVQEWKTKE